MNRLAIPLFTIRHGLIGGVESAIYNLTKGLWSIEKGMKVAFSRPEYLAPEYRRWLSQNGVPSKQHRSFGRSIPARFAEETSFGLLEGSERVIYPNYFLPITCRSRTNNAVIIHDLQYKVYPRNFTAKKRAWLELNYRRALRYADRIFFISEFERDQALRYFGSAFQDRSHVIYNAIDWTRYQEIDASPEIRRLARAPYILSVAHQHPHKNIETLIAAFAIVGKKQRNLSLILVGKPSPRVQLATESLLEPSLQSRVHFTGFVSDPDLGFLYRGMSVFALPSLYEGFGMPAVEAMGFEKPVLLADSGALREVTNDKAAYLPRDSAPAAWAECLDDLIEGTWRAPDGIHELRDFYHPAAVARRAMDALER